MPIFFPPACELLLLLLIALFALIRAYRVEVIRLRLREIIHACAKRPQLTIVVLSGFVFLSLAVLGFFFHLPQPAYHDEFVYLLMADTYAHGRLTNETHSLWPSFHSFYVLQQPTYQGKYPPASAVFMAIGQVLTGMPIVGVWLATALACGATGWMFLAYMSKRWSVIGTVLVATHTGVVLQWGQGYWGGAVAMAGGALVYGALPRIIRCPSMRDAVIMGIGISLLANSRPYEGLVAVLPAALVILAWLVFDRRFSKKTRLFSVTLPIVTILLANSLWMAHYNFRVTGDPFEMPYLHWAKQSQINISRLVVTKSLRNSLTMLFGRSDDGLRRDHQGVRRAADNGNINAPTLPVVRFHLPSRVGKLAKFSLFYTKVILLFGLIGIPWIVWQSWYLRVIVASTFLTLIAVLFTPTSGHPHYLAPAAAPLFCVAVLGIRWFQRSAMQFSPATSNTLQFLPLISLAVFLLSLTYSAMVKYHPDRQWSIERAKIEGGLSEQGAEHLVVVRYGPNHNGFCEWVYNGADIDGSQVVWARESNPEQNRRLLDYFSDRKLWLLEADSIPPRLTLLERNEDGSYTPGPTTLPEELGSYVFVRKPTNDLAQSSTSETHDRK